MTSRTHAYSPFMEFAKLSHAKYPLGSSGVAGMTLAEFGPIDGLALNGPGGDYGNPALLERIASYCGVTPNMVVAANGCSMANHLAFAALFEPGEEVLLEQPTYELLTATLEFLGAKVRRFQRPAEQGFRVDPTEIERNLTPRTRLIVFCNLHNPSSAIVDEPTLRAAGELARSIGARVLVDEVYLEAVWPRPRTAALLGPEFVVTSSLTKAYGLSGLRCGWILGDPELVSRIWWINDLFGVHQPFVADQFSIAAFDRIDRVAARAKNLLGTNRPIALGFLRSRTDLECFIPEHGTTLFPRLKRGNVEALAKLLRDEYETMIVPGCYFEMPQHFRLGLGIATETLREGLARLAAALDRI
ncbi:MAG: aminotransferase class I/II-fold pyridoxal phosphate-dependent enzyme [Terriglobales bacterium]